MAAKKKNTIEVEANVLRAILYGNSSLPLAGRMDLMNRGGTSSQFEGARNIAKVAGYPTTLMFDDYFQAYDRQDIATRVVETYPDYTWIEPPEVYESEEAKNTAFEQDWLDLCAEQDIIGTIKAFDILSGIGEYGVLVFGIDDNKTLKDPLIPSRKHKLMYMRPYHQGEIVVDQWDTDPNSERYMLPSMYKITPYEYKDNNIKTPLSGSSFYVHHTRVLHFADNALNSRIIGVPRLKRVYDRMIDILKIVAGSGEMFWRGAYQGFSFEADADGEISEEDGVKMKEDIQKYLMGLDRAMLLKGVKTNPLSPSVSSPKEHLDAQLKMVSIASRIPTRILTGSEQGKLASTEDAKNWALQIKTRRTNVAEPRILRPFIKFCTTNGIIASPSKTFKVLWPELVVPTDKDQSESAMNFTNALSTYATSGLYHVMPFKEYLMNVWNYPVAKAEAMSQGLDIKAFEKLAQAAKKPKETPASTKNETPEP